MGVTQPNNNIDRNIRICFVLSCIIFLTKQVNNLISLTMHAITEFLLFGYLRFLCMRIRGGLEPQCLLIQARGPTDILNGTFYQFQLFSRQQPTLPQPSSFSLLLCDLCQLLKGFIGFSRNHIKTNPKNLV